MKVKTSHGEVELTAEMVCRGMVFSADDGANQITIGDGSAAEANQRRAVEICDALLGCDPAIATRSDCERFGVHGDAAAHGFARLRDGGVVDLRRETPTGTVHQTAGTQSIRLARQEGRSPRVYPLSEHERFVGLDMRHARAEDIRRLCCGATNGIHVSFNGRAETVGHTARCTLAIGEHDHHEDLATGVRWPAKESAAATGIWYARAAVEGTGESIQARALTRAYNIGCFGSEYLHRTPEIVTCARCNGPAEANVFGPTMVTLASAHDPGRREQAPVCARCVEVMWLNWQAWVIRDGKIEAKAAPAMSGAAGAFCAFVAGLKAWAASPAGREAALVALVRSPPGWADPTAWGAAVLAVAEYG